MASGLIMAGMLGGAGQGLQQAGAQAQKAMDEKELQAARQSAEDKRQERLIEANKSLAERGYEEGRKGRQEQFGYDVAKEGISAETRRKQTERDQEFTKDLQLEVLSEGEKYKIAGERRKLADEREVVFTPDGKGLILGHDKKALGYVTDKDGNAIDFGKLSEADKTLIASHVSEVGKLRGRKGTGLQTPEQIAADEQQIAYHEGEIESLTRHKKPEGATVDPQLKAYADKYFRGDVKAATAAILKQKQTGQTPEPARRASAPGLIESQSTNPVPVGPFGGGPGL